MQKCIVACNSFLIHFVQLDDLVEEVPPLHNSERFRRESWIQEGSDFVLFFQLNLRLSHTRHLKDWSAKYFCRCTLSECLCHQCAQFLHGYRRLPQFLCFNFFCGRFCCTFSSSFSSGFSSSFSSGFSSSFLFIVLVKFGVIKNLGLNGDGSLVDCDNLYSGDVHTKRGSHALHESRGAIACEELSSSPI